jgi:hypothetical protein
VHYETLRKQGFEVTFRELIKCRRSQIQFEQPWGVVGLNLLHHDLAPTVGEVCCFCFPFGLSGPLAGGKGGWVGIGRLGGWDPRGCSLLLKIPTTKSSRVSGALAEGGAQSSAAQRRVGLLCRVTSIPVHSRDARKEAIKIEARFEVTFDTGGYWRRYRRGR